MSAKSKILSPGHRVSVRNPKPGQSKWIQDTSIDLAPGDTLAVTTVAAPPPVDPPPPPPPTGTTRTAKSVAELLSMLPDETIDKIVGVPGATWFADNPTAQGPNSLWIDDRFRRTRKAIVDLTGVTLDGHGGRHGFLTFLDGACNQEWIAPTYANAIIGDTGAIQIAGYAGLPGPHHLTIRKPKALASVLRANAGRTTDHFFYFSYATGDWGDILIEDVDVDATAPMGLATAVQADHGYVADAPNVTARRVTIRRTKYRGNRKSAPGTPPVQQALLLWQPPFHDWLFDGADIQDANGGNGGAARFESRGASNIVFKDIVSVNSGGFYSSLGVNPPGVTKINCSFG